MTIERMRLLSLAALLALCHAGGCVSKQAAHAVDAEPGYLRDITALVGPVHDGNVIAMLVTTDRAYSFVQGTGQACYDGWLRSTSVRDGGHSEVLHLGANSAMSKEAGVLSESPSFVAAIDSHRFVFNLNCSASFPKDGPVRGISGNVVLFDSTTGEFRNLTRLNGSDVTCQFVEALEWFPAERVLLAEASELSSSDSPIPRQGTGKGICLSIDDGSMRPLASYPRLQRIYETRRSIAVELADGPQSPDTPLWQVRWANGRVALSSQTGHPVAVIPLERTTPTVIVASPMQGTWIADATGQTLVRVSEDVGIWFDRPTNTLYLRSRYNRKEPEGHGSADECTRYFALNLDAYSDHLRDLLADASAPDR